MRVPAAVDCVGIAEVADMSDGRLVWWWDEGGG